jgi:hypothetical protein
MFGYVVVDRQELKCRELEEYRGFYCGLCKALHKGNGLMSRFCVNYDLTFLSILYADLYDPEITTAYEHCIIHPISRRQISHHEYEKYCSDMNIYLTWLKCIDDWEDDKKLFRRIYAGIIGGKAKKIEKAYPEKCGKIKECMKALSDKEKAESEDIDAVSGDFGRMLSEIFVMKDDEWKEILSNTGFFLGKFIYILDAYDDLEKDIKKNNYNPLKSLSKKEGFDDEMKQILTMYIAECCRSFEILPLVEFSSILKNILYLGVWTRYDIARYKKEHGGKMPELKKTIVRNERQK